MSPGLPMLGLASSRAYVSGQGREGREHRASGFSEAAPKCQMMQARELMGTAGFSERQTLPMRDRTQKELED